MSKLEILDDKIIFNGVEYFPKESEQKTININGFEVPEPVRDNLYVGEKIFMCLFGGDMYVEDIWRGSARDFTYLRYGLIHLTKEAAIKHAEALLSFTRKN